MGLLDQLKKAFGDATETAASESAKLAAKGTADALKRSVAAVGDDFLDDAEAMVERGEKEREGRDDYGPSTSVADEIARQVEAATEAGKAQAVAPSEDAAAARHAAAVEELARLKAAMGKGGEE